LYFQLVNDENVMKMITGRPLSRTEALTKFQHILKINEQSRQFGYYAVRNKWDGIFVGLAKVVLANEGEAEIGYMILPEYWGKGYGTEISQQLIGYCKGIAGLKSLLAIIDPENQASKRILEKGGFNLDEACEIAGLPAEIYKLVFKKLPLTQ